MLNSNATEGRRPRRRGERGFRGEGGGGGRRGDGEAQHLRFPQDGKAMGGASGEASERGNGSKIRLGFPFFASFAYLCIRSKIL